MLRKGTACVASMTIPDSPVLDPEIRPHRALPVFYIRLGYCSMFSTFRLGTGWYEKDGSGMTLPLFWAEILHDLALERIASHDSSMSLVYII